MKRSHVTEDFNDGQGLSVEEMEFAKQLIQEKMDNAEKGGATFQLALLPNFADRISRYNSHWIFTL